MLERGGGGAQPSWRANKCGDKGFVSVDRQWNCLHTSREENSEGLRLSSASKEYSRIYSQTSSHSGQRSFQITAAKIRIVLLPNN